MGNGLLEMIKSSKLDLTKLYLIAEGGDTLNKSHFEIKSKDFLRFARQDLQDGDARGFINSLTNSKRAIDCKIDEVFESLGIKTKFFMDDFTDYAKLKDFEKDIPEKLRIIHGINLAPSLLISKTRTLRNKLEHIYRMPELSEVKDSLDVADLFIRSIEGKFNLVMTSFYLTDENNYRIENDWRTLRGLYFLFDTEKLRFEINLKNEKDILEEIIVTEADKSFCALLGLMFSNDDQIEAEESLRLLLKYIEHPVPSRNVSLELA